MSPRPGRCRQQRRREAREAEKAARRAARKAEVHEGGHGRGGRLTHAGPGIVMAGVLAASLGLAGVPAPALAQAPEQAAAAEATRHRLDVAAGPLRRALNELSSRTGIVIVDPEDLAGDLETRGLGGLYSVEEALRALLEGTGVTYRFTNSRAIRLEPGELPPVYVLPGLMVLGTRQDLASPKYTQPLRDLPQTVNVISQEVLEGQGVTTLREAVRNIPGLTVNAGEGGATPGDNFTIRGFSARSDLFVDGVRGRGGGYSRETFNVEQVEVSKGPASNYAGRGTTGGAINLVSKTPRALEGRSATAGIGTAGYKRATLDLNEPLGVLGGGAAFRLNAAWEDTEVAGLDVVERSMWGIAPALALGLASPTRLTLSYYRSEQDNIPSYGMQSQEGEPDVNTHAFFGLTDLDFERVEASHASAVLEHDLSPALTLRDQLTWAASDVRRVVTFGNLTGLRSTRSHITTDDNLSNQLTLTAALATGEVAHDLVAGLDVTRETSRLGSYGFSENPPAIEDMNNPDPSSPYAGTMEPRRFRRNVEATTVGAYLFETMEAGPLQLSGSLRFDAFSPQYTDSLGVVSPEIDTRTLSWRAGAVYKPVVAASVYAGFGTSFNPSGELLAMEGGTNGLEDPEENHSYEVGVKWETLDRGLLFSAAGFRTDKRNARIEDPDDPEGNRVILAGKQRVQGVELGTSGALAPAWRVQAAYTYLASEILKSDDPAEEGAPFPNTPKHSLSAWSTFTLPGSLELALGGRYVDERLVRSSSGEYWVPSYTSFDAEAAYDVRPGFSLRLNLINLTDATYYDTGRFWVPSPGRWLKLTSTIQF